MNLALNDGERVTASPNQKAICPSCKEEVISKCGSIKVWHWAHKSGTECDSWSELESEWHINWKNQFPKEQQEITICKDNIKHRADIKNKNDVVIELQNCPISPEEIMERENFYKNMVWLLNGNNLAKGLNLRNKNGLITFRWKHPNKSFWNADKQLYVELNKIWIGEEFKENCIFLIKKLYSHCPCGGYGIILSKEEFLRRFL